MKEEGQREDERKDGRRVKKSKVPYIPRFYTEQCYTVIYCNILQYAMMYSDMLWYTVIYCDVQVIYMPVLSLYALFHDVGNLPGQTCCLHLEPAAAAVSQGNQE